MNTRLTGESLAEFTSAHQPPCLSLYQPTHRCHPENQQDLIRFRNLLKVIVDRFHTQPLRRFLQTRRDWPPLTGINSITITTPGEKNHANPN